MWLCKLHNFGGKKSVMCSLEGYIYICGIACYSTASMAICVLRRAQERQNAERRHENEAKLQRNRQRTQISGRRNQPVLNAPTKYSAHQPSPTRWAATTSTRSELTGPDNLDLEDALHRAGFDADGDSRRYDEPDTYESGLGGMARFPPSRITDDEHEELGLGRTRREKLPR